MDIKIVINSCYGGFSLSHAALHRLREMKNEAVLGEIARDDPQLIAVVEEMGEKANGTYASLKVVEIPEGTEWIVEEYDGVEWVSQAHGTWS